MQGAVFGCLRDLIDPTSVYFFVFFVVVVVFVFCLFFLGGKLWTIRNFTNTYTEEHTNTILARVDLYSNHT